MGSISGSFKNGYSLLMKTLPCPCLFGEELISRRKGVGHDPFHSQR